MKTFSHLKKAQHLLHAFICFKSSLFTKYVWELCFFKLSLFTEYVWALTKRLYWFLIFHSSPLLVQICYFVSLSFAGFLALRNLNAKSQSSQPNDIDLFFMSVSASTLSSMATVEMEVFSQSQLWVLILLMLLGGEVFTSMLGLQFIKSKMEKEDELMVGSQSRNSGNQVEESGVVKIGNNLENGSIDLENIDEKYPKHKPVEYLRNIVLAYLILVIGTGSTFVYLYLTLVPSAKDVVSSKGIQISTFSIFLTVSSFGNCGFMPTNENMVVFKNNSALLLLTIFQILAGNTLYPLCLRLVIWVLKKLKKGDMFDYILQTPGEVIGYNHPLSYKKSTYLALTVSGFVLVQLILFCSREWNSDGLQGMNSYQKFVGALFLSVNSRHAGESTLDLSALSSAVLVLYIVMMYLPPYSTFLPIKDDGSTMLAHEKEGVKEKNLLKDLSLSNLSYLVIFVVVICITERRALSADPLNFNVLNIVFEVTRQCLWKCWVLNWL
ncbi:putative cation transporter HKT6 [Iris pallida]|uniref:Cation transporter HKT6 n=1 Tax=Iris pallida TaxID=29817 RepID=A0AAX6HE31_IRIPA|nr:putative cation transporter HKT6 [Iris pallida]